MVLRSMIVLFFLCLLGVEHAYGRAASQSSELGKDPCGQISSTRDRHICYDNWVNEAVEAVDNIFGQLVGDKGRELGVNSKERTVLRRYYQTYDRDMHVRCRKLEYHCKRSAASEAYSNFIRFTRMKIEENERLEKDGKKTKPYPNLEKMLKQ